MSAPSLRLGPDLVLPFDAVTDTFGWVGNKGAGKTFGAKVAAEEMLKAGAQVVVLDPVDAWWGLRYGPTRGTSGLPVYVFGGYHGDLPLEPTAGALMADVVVEQRVSVVLSLRRMSKAAQRRFVADFLNRLYLRKGEPEYRTPVHVVLEEAHTFAPQGQLSSGGEEKACLGAVQDVVLQGRQSGLGVSLVTQRVAALSRSVLELAEVLCAFRTTGPNARKALEAWFRAQDDTAERYERFVAGVSGLARGECWVWSPGLLGLFEQVRIRPAETFDSSATPEAGKVAPAPKGRPAQLDLGELGVRIAETVERARADDPKALRARVAELEQELQGRPAETERVEVVRYQVPPGLVEALAALQTSLTGALGDARKAAQAQAERLEALRTETLAALAGTAQVLQNAVPDANPLAGPPPEPARRALRSVPADRGEVRVVPSPSPSSNGGPPGGAAERLLAVLARHDPNPRTRRQAAAEAGVSSARSTLRNALSRLRTAGYVTDEGDLLHLTAAGRDAAAHVEALPAGPALLDYWRAKLGDGYPRRIFDHAVGRYPEPLSREATAAVLGIDPQTSTLRNSLSRLRTLGLLERGTLVRVPDELMEAAR